jgi:site-specific DNA-methyltransferase (adenine-specific)
LAAPVVAGMRDTIRHGNCLSEISKLNDCSVALTVTSPPYAQQRRNLYDGVDEDNYPSWTAAWMDALRPKLRADASVLINIREHVHDGCISDYVLRTRLALRDAGWHEIEELIWHKPDAPPLGSVIRPRRTWERVLWFAPSRRPFVDLYESGTGSGDSAFAPAARRRRTSSVRL